MDNLKDMKEIGQVNMGYIVNVLENFNLAQELDKRVWHEYYIRKGDSSKPERVLACHDFENDTLTFYSKKEFYIGDLTFFLSKHYK